MGVGVGVGDEAHVGFAWRDHREDRVERGDLGAYTDVVSFCVTRPLTSPTRPFDLENSGKPCFSAPYPRERTYPGSCKSAVSVRR